MGLFLGMVPVIGFPITIPEMGGKILFIGLTLGIAAFISSFFIGTLFGMPKRNNKKETNYSLNNSLTDISDWLSKIIIGLVLVNLKEIIISKISETSIEIDNYDPEFNDVPVRRTYVSFERHSKLNESTLADRFCIGPI